MPGLTKFRRLLPTYKLTIVAQGREYGGPGVDDNDGFNEGSSWIIFSGASTSAG